MVRRPDRVERLRLQIVSVAPSIGFSHPTLTPFDRRRGELGMDKKFRYLTEPASA